MVIAGIWLRIVCSTVSKLVSHKSSRLSEKDPIRLARILICFRDSSPDMYSTLRPSAAICLHTCKSRVDLPIPGSPPTSVREPGTMPPPNTLSNSAMCVLIRSSSCMSTAVRLVGKAPSRLRVLWLAPPLFTGAFSSTMVFHSLHPGHCPIHLEDSYPQF